MEEHSWLFMMDAKSFHITSTKPIPLYYPTHFGGSTIAAHVKGCGKWRDIIFLFNEFWWKLGGCLFDHLGILWEGKCLQFETNKFFMLFVKFCIIFVLYFIKLVKHVLDCGVEDRFSHKTWKRVRNNGGFIRDSNVFSGAELCVIGGRHNEE